MGLIGSLVWVNTYSRKQCRNLFWRMRAALKKAVKNGEKQQLRFHYDPSSYALNFDDGFCKQRETQIASSPSQHAKPHSSCSDIKNTKWVYILWVKTEWNHRLFFFFFSDEWTIPSTLLINILVFVFWWVK